MIHTDIGPSPWLVGAKERAYHPERSSIFKVWPTIHTPHTQEPLESARFKIFTGLQSSSSLAHSLSRCCPKQVQTGCSQCRHVLSFPSPEEAHRRLSNQRTSARLGKASFVWCRKENQAKPRDPSLLKTSTIDFPFSLTWRAPCCVAFVHFYSFEAVHSKKKWMSTANKFHSNSQNIDLMHLVG